MTSTIAGSSSMIMILAIKSQRGEYFSFEKKKAEMRIGANLGSGCFSRNHRPRFAFECENLFKNFAPVPRNCDEIGMCTSANLSKQVILPQRSRRIQCDHREDFFRRNLGKVSLKFPHLTE